MAVTIRGEKGLSGVAAPAEPGVLSAGAQNRIVDLQAPKGSISRLGYRPELDGLRGTAVILVIFADALGWPRGSFIGVDMFFALSGFLITTLLLEEWNAYGSISLRHFYWRRYYRLFPALAVLIVIYTLYVLLFVNSGVGLRLRDAGFGITYLANWAQAVKPFPYTAPDTGYLWTLAIEEQFYLVWPVLLVLLLNGRVGLRGTKWAVLAMIVAVVAWRNVLISHGADPNRLYFGTDTRFDELLVGCLASAFYVSRRRQPIRARWLLMTATVGAVLFLTYRIFKVNQWTFWTMRISLTLVAIATTVVIYACVTDSFVALKRVLSARWLVFTGKISYSLYLWHIPVDVVLRKATALTRWQLTVLEFVLAFVAALASYYWVERTFLRRRQKHQRLHATKADLEYQVDGTQDQEVEISSPAREPEYRLP
jgi:peptidoglycan/LPS O-acetylase OafA/YrhL